MYAVLSEPWNGKVSNDHGVNLPTGRIEILEEEVDFRYARLPAR